MHKFRFNFSFLVYFSSYIMCTLKQTRGKTYFENMHYPINNTLATHTTSKT